MIGGFQVGAFQPNFQQLAVDPPVVDQASNWQAHHRGLWKRKSKEDEELERILLGILPPDVAPEVVEAVAERVVSSDVVLRAEPTPLDRAEIHQIYLEEFAKAAQERQREIKRRAYTLLLIH